MIIRQKSIDINEEQAKNALVEISHESITQNHWVTKFQSLFNKKKFHKLNQIRKKNIKTQSIHKYSQPRQDYYHRRRILYENINEIKFNQRFSPCHMNSNRFHTEDNEPIQMQKQEKKRFLNESFDSKISKYSKNFKKDLENFNSPDIINQSKKIQNFIKNQNLKLVCASKRGSLTKPFHFSQDLIVRTPTQCYQKFNKYTSSVIKQYPSHYVHLPTLIR